MSADRDRAVLDAITRVEEAGEPVNASRIAAVSGVSRSYIYRHADLIGRIELAGQEQEREAAGDEGDKRTINVTFRISPNIAALIRKAQGGEGGTASQFAWDAVIAELADRLDVDPWVIDPVKRQARRRPNRNKRTSERTHDA